MGYFRQPDGGRIRDLPKEDRTKNDPGFFRIVLYLYRFLRSSRGGENDQSIPGIADHADRGIIDRRKQVFLQDFIGSAGLKDLAFLQDGDPVCIAGGEIQITTDKDGLHAENDDDDSTGFVYICGGTLKVLAGDDAIHATTIVQIDGGELALNAREGLEGTWIQINNGTVNIQASDDGINAAYKSAKIAPTAEFNGGTVTIVMGSGDTDAVDSNGNLVINGGTLDITAQSPFDYDGTCQKTGGTLIINGTETDDVSNQMMGGRGGHGGRSW